MTTLNTWLREATMRLQQAGIESGRLDCLILLEDLTGRNRAWLLAHDETALDEAQLNQLQTAIERRTTHEPLAYIRGHAEFYGRRFKVTPATLVPRPESEALIELATSMAATTALDVGTGSGCLGITLKLEQPNTSVMLSDVDPAALAVALRNAQVLGADVTALQSDLLASTIGSFDLIVANLPYVPDEYPINAAAKHEPELALFSGADGLDHYRRFWRQVGIARPRSVVTEAFPEQHAALAELAKRAGYAPARSQGFAQAFTLIRPEGQLRA